MLDNLLLMTNIFTVTLNTAVDRVIELDALNVGGVNESAGHSEIAAGKGINVSRALGSVQIESTAYCFCGDLDRDIFEEIATDYVRPIIFAVNGRTRTNLTILETDERRATHIKTDGYVVGSGDIDAMIASVTSAVATEDILVVSGSLPTGFSNARLRDLLRAGAKSSQFLFLDLNPASYSVGLEFRPFAVKPNLQELEEIAGKSLSDSRQIAAAAKELSLGGAKIVLVTLGADGVIAFSRAESVALLVRIPVGERPSNDDAVGSGDAFLAGFIEAVIRGAPLRESLMNACAFGAANQKSIIPGQVRKHDVRHFLSLTETVEILMD